MAITIIGIVIGAILLKDLPQIFVGVNDSQTMSYTTYDSAMMAIIASTLGHLGSSLSSVWVSRSAPRVA